MRTVRGVTVSDFPFLWLSRDGQNSRASVATCSGRDHKISSSLKKGERIPQSA